MEIRKNCRRNMILLLTRCSFPTMIGRFQDTHIHSSPIYICQTGAVDEPSSALDLAGEFKPPWSKERKNDDLPLWMEHADLILCLSRTARTLKPGLIRNCWL